MEGRPATHAGTSQITQAVPNKGDGMFPRSDWRRHAYRSIQLRIDVRLPRRGGTGTRASTCVDVCIRVCTRICACTCTRARVGTSTDRCTWTLGLSLSSLRKLLLLATRASSITARTPSVPILRHMRRWGRPKSHLHGGRGGGRVNWGESVWRGRRKNELAHHRGLSACRGSRRNPIVLAGRMHGRRFGPLSGALRACRRRSLVRGRD